MYREEGWDLIDDKVYYALGRTSFVLGFKDQSGSFFLQLLAKPPPNSNTQTAYLKDFVHVFKILASEKTDKSWLPEFPLPSLSDETVDVSLSVPDSLYVLEDSSSPSSGDWQNLHRSVLTSRGVTITRPRKTPKGLLFSPLGESIFVEFDVKNPLLVPLQLTSVELLCEVSPEAHENTEDSSGVFTKSDVETDTIDLSLPPSSTKRVKLSIRPLKEGYMYVRGIGFWLGGEVYGKRLFHLKPRRLNSNKQERQSVIYAPNPLLSFRIINTLPLLRTQLNISEDSGVPQGLNTVLAGGLKKRYLTLQNTGGDSLINLRIASSPAAFVSFGTPFFGSSELEDLASLSNSLGNEDSSIRKEDEVLNSESSPVFCAPVQEIAPSQILTIPYWFRPHILGDQQLTLLFYYEPAKPNAEVPYRLHRHQTSVSVEPTFGFDVSLNSSLRDLESFLLKTQIANHHYSEFFSLRQISCVSRRFEIRPITTDNNDSSVRESEGILGVGPHQSTYLFFKIVPLNNPTGARTHSSLPFNGWKTLESTEAPYKDLLQQEKCERQRILNASNKKNQSGFGNTDNSDKIEEKEKERDKNSLDFILFWQTTQLQALQGISTTTLTLPFSSDPLLSKPFAPSAETSLRYLLEVPSRVVHDFDNMSLCSVPVILRVKNISSESISFFLETFKSSDIKESSDSMGNFRPQYFWAGKTLTSVSDLPPENEVSLTVTACFSRAGVYNLNRFRLNTTGSNRALTPSQQHLITVDNR
eukprot:TRINITY_DN7507_c0_g1_i1.p1 TRINITY_DN7507_c0_g1~~TRINITY_DN7507_c0_g1_i1.p1  ORF type:complete len:860 (+),score=186.81 TRINITY_DN7507_c0_g1_i1:321-2582(+)